MATRLLLCIWVKNYLHFNKLKKEGKNKNLDFPLCVLRHLQHFQKRLTM